MRIIIHRRNDFSGLDLGLARDENESRIRATFAHLSNIIHINNITIGPKKDESEIQRMIADTEKVKIIVDCNLQQGISTQEALSQIRNAIKNRGDLELILISESALPFSPSLSLSSNPFDEFARVQAEIDELNSWGNPPISSSNSSRFGHSSSSHSSMFGNSHASNPPHRYQHPSSVAQQLFDEPNFGPLPFGLDGTFK